jgi:hypothetical protein
MVQQLGTADVCPLRLANVLDPLGFYDVYVLVFTGIRVGNAIRVMPQRSAPLGKTERCAGRVG